MFDILFENKIIFLEFKLHKRCSRIRAQALSSETELSHLTKRILKAWENIEEMEPIVQKEWKPKNPEVALPVAADVSLSKKQWRESNFPYHSMLSRHFPQFFLESTKGF